MVKFRGQECPGVAQTTRGLSPKVGLSMHHQFTNHPESRRDPVSGRFTSQPERPFAERFWEKVDRSGDCWIWQGAKTPLGYGVFYTAGSTQQAHRIAYEMVHGPILSVLVIDHLCRTPACVNPAHLEPVAQRENVLRGESPSARNARKTHCKNGHEFTPANTYYFRGDRRCNTCHREAERLRYHINVGVVAAANQIRAMGS